MSAHEKGLACGQGFVAGDRIMDRLIRQKATIVRPIQSAILPSWTVAYVVNYDEPPPMEYNMGAIEGLVFSKYAARLKKTKRP